MKERILAVVAPLASLKYQERFIIHGSKDRYTTGLDLMADVDGLFDELIRNAAAKSEQFERAQWAAIMEFEMARRAEGIIAPGYYTMSNREFVYGHEPWVRLRVAAEKLLRALGLDLAVWEEEQRGTWTREV
jgi:hypothetical protein